MIRFIFLVFCFSFSFQILIAQNLIPNPGFEEKEIKTYNKTGQYFRAKYWDWIQPRGEYAPWTGMHIDKTMLPSIESRLNSNINFNFIPVYPYQGNCYMRSIGCKYKNVIQVKLKQLISKGVVYYFEMYYRIGAEEVEKHEADPFLINQADFGIVFRNKNSFDIPFMTDLYNDKIILKPQIQVKSNDSTPIKQWTKFSAYFIPTMDYTYFLIGNFKDLGQHNPKIWQGIAEFYIDNLLLTPYETILAKDLLTINNAFVLQGIVFQNTTSSIF